MKRFPRVAVVASTLVMVVPAIFPEVAAATVEDQRREVQRIVDELDRLHAQADILAEDWAEAEDNLRQLEIDVIAAEASVAAKEAELNSLRGDLSEVALRSLTGSGGGDVLGPLFSNAEIYSDGLRRDSFSRVALSVGTGTTDDLDELISDLDDERQDLESKKAQVETLKATIESKQSQTVEVTAEYEARRTQEEARLGQLIEEEEQRRAAAAFAQLQAELAAQEAASAAASAATPAAGGGNGGGGGGGNTSTGATNSGGNGGGGGGGGGSAPAPAPAPKAVSNVPAVSGLAGIAIQAAQNQIGVSYRYATSSPGVSFDCSGLTHYAWGQAGVYLPRNSRAQAAATPRVPSAAAQPGDLIFYYSPISHVGIYIGGGRLIHAPNSGSKVKVANVSWGKVTAVGRPG